MRKQRIIFVVGVIIISMAMVLPVFKVNAAVTYNKWTADYYNEDTGKTLTVTFTAEAIYKGQIPLSYEITSSDGSCNGSGKKTITEVTSNIYVRGFTVDCNNKAQIKSTSHKKDKSKGEWYWINESTIRNTSSYSEISCNYYSTSNGREGILSLDANGKISFSMSGKPVVQSNYAYTLRKIYREKLINLQCPVYMFYNKPNWFGTSGLEYGDHNETPYGWKEYETFSRTKEDHDATEQNAGNKAHAKLESCIVKNNIDINGICQEKLDAFNTAIQNQLGDAELYKTAKEYNECVKQAYPKEVKEKCEESSTIVDQVEDNMAGPDVEFNVGEVTCDALARVMKFASEIFQLICIFMGVGLVVLGMLDYLRAVMNADQEALKKATKRFSTRLVIMALMILLPVLINWVLDMFMQVDSCLGFL